MNRYIKKRIVISLFYLLLLLIIVDVIYLKVQAGKPTCHDGIQNQKETDIDCGGPCKPCLWEQLKLKTILTAEVATVDNYVDLAAKIENPYRSWGAKEFSYVFNLYDDEGGLIASKEGVSYILPQETKYIIEQKVLAGPNVFEIEFKVVNVNWQEVVDYEDPDLLIRNPEFEKSEGQSKITGMLENRSNYDFDTIEIWAILFDNYSKILGAGRSEAKTVISGETRYFEVGWFFSIKEQVYRFDVIAKTNVFLDENFMKRYAGEREKFQEY